MTDEAIASATADIESTTDLLERALEERVLFAYCPPTAECVPSFGAWRCGSF